MIPLPNHLRKLTSRLRRRARIRLPRHPISARMGEASQADHLLGIKSHPLWRKELLATCLGKLTRTGPKKVVFEKKGQTT